MSFVRLSGLRSALCSSMKPIKAVRAKKIESFVLVKSLGSALGMPHADESFVLDAYSDNTR